MTIREIEARSGMTRANIRFYEAEGLLAPERRENGYRAYSEDDLAALLRIRLMRALRVPLGDIRAMQSGEAALSDTLARQADALAQEREELGRARAVCRDILANETDYASLDAQRFLDALAQRHAVPDEDVLPYDAAPVRRFFARVFDLEVYRALICIVLALVFRVNLGRASNFLLVLLWLGETVLMVFLEPLFLSRLGTTPGKWLLGLGVTDLDGGRLTYEAAFERTASALCRGMLFRLPGWELWALFRSLRACDNGVPLPWEDDSIITVRPWRRWRAAACGGAYAASIGLALLAVLLAGRPPHRGELTVAQLCDNYNYIVRYYESDPCWLLDDHGEWIENPDGIIDLFNDLAPRPALVFSLSEEGYVTGVSFEQTLADEGIPPSYADERAYLTLALAGAQRGAGLTMRAAREAADTVFSHPYDDLALYAYGVAVESETDYEGYDSVGASLYGLVMREDAAAYTYSIRFSLLLG